MTKRIMNRLDIVNSAKVLDYVRDNYAAYKMTDDKFAEKATEDLGFTVLSSHVEKRRMALGVPSTSNRPGPKNTAALYELVLELEQRVVALEKRG